MNTDTKTWGQKLKVDGIWMQYPNSCRNYEGENHKHKGGEICHHDDGYYCEHRAKYVKSIIRDLLASQLEEVADKIELFDVKPEEYEEITHYRQGYERALSDVASYLKGEMK